MFNKENFQTAIKLHMEKFRVLKEAKLYEEAITELEKLISLMSGAVLEIFGKKLNYVKEKPILLEGVRNVTLEDVLDPHKVILIDKEGTLKIKK